ncbi:MAG: arylsulfotransferase (ASST) [Desulfobacterales bacterium]|nr:arylsulfotransferase (ASST) [Desulfobacterales bacterium]
MTGTAGTFHISTIKSMAVVFFALLLFSGVDGYAGATSAVPDIKVNGQDDMITLTSNSAITATVQLDAGKQAGEQADWWILASTSVGWFFYEDPGIWQFGGAGAEVLRPAFQEPLYNMTEPLEVLNITGLPTGVYAFYFAVDTTVNGLVDVGSLSYDFAAFEVLEDATPSDGYNLFSPLGSKTTYLMDNDGDILHSWSGNYRPGNAVYLLDDGTLLRTANTRDTMFNEGGAGGRVEHFNWDGDQLWEFEYRGNQYRLHHDIETLPNGNVLMIAWELKSEAEAIAAGRNPSLLRDGELWPDHVIEVEPTGPSGGNIVWEWHVWDHLIQDYDATKENHGVVADHPELIDLNYARNSGADWNHINSIDYNADLDQIMLSVHGFSEIWVIDHGTSTAEATGHTGGDSGRGGDLLYRWGNPQAYDAGGALDQQLFVQHDAKWIGSGLPGEDNILIFNNGQGRPDGNYSSVDEIVPPVNPDGSYVLATGASYGPDAPLWSYTATPVTDFYAQNISGAQRLPNGNTLICRGPDGLFFEVTTSGEKVWEYDYDGAVFRVERYSPSYVGLD